MRNVFHALSIGFVVSAIFYFIVVWLPAWQRKVRILGNLQLHYNAFKLSCISTFLVYSDSQDYEPQEMLLDQEEFRRYFSIYTSTDQTRWHNVANALDRGAYPLRDILNELEILREELLYVLNNIDVHDEKVFGFLKRLSHAIFRIKHLEPGYDDVKSLCHFLWEIFTGYSFSEGYRKEDIVQSMIEKV
ncbi:hypothetical protein ACTRXD_09175 [Nitrospira sp. T9]|uniref:hypothetical protein n=1 Tax=unclassified Nitrospira TaxID=2652172 RepID=UPI003F9E07C8